jgi:hypothetical protein
MPRLAPVTNAFFRSVTPPPSIDHPVGDIVGPPCAPVQTATRAARAVHRV